MMNRIQHLLTRPVGRPPKKPVVLYHGFEYQAQSWNKPRRLVLPTAVKHWTLTTMRDKLVKIGAKIVRHARHVMFQLVEVAVPRNLFRQMLNRIKRLEVQAPLAVSG
jgi:hypothetical protein